MDTDIEILLYDYDGAAKALSLSRAALRDLVYKGRGPTITKIGRRTFFAREDLDTFINNLRNSRSIGPTSLSNAGTRKRGRPTIADKMK